jgi:hypothetical protein
LSELEAEGRALLADAGIAAAQISLERSADMRLTGQMHEINVPLPVGTIDDGSLGAIRAAFAQVYTRRYTSFYGEAAIEAVSFRVRVLGPAPELSLRQAGGAGLHKQKGARQVWFGDGFVEAKVYDRYALAPGDTLEGPAIVEEREATTIVPPGDTLHVDPNLNLRLAIGSAAPPQALVTPGTPLAQAMARIESDPISLEIMWSRLVTVVDEMWLTVIRTTSPASCSTPRASRWCTRRARCRCSIFACRAPSRHCWRNIRPTRWSRATCWSPTTRGCVPGTCSISRCSRRSFVRAGSSVSSAPSGMSAISAAPRIRSKRARSSRKASRSRR